jgi:peptidyl-prolyl cis-trans isomerase B (cyclophilin B)
MIQPVLFAAIVCAQAQTQPAKAPGLTVAYPYNGIHQPVMLEAVSPRNFGKVTLALMNIDGSLVGEAVEVYPGRIDLAEVMPDVWKLQRAAYLQMFDLNQPIGSALVVQPMLSRMVPVTETARRPNGSTYTRIKSWIDENTPPQEPPPTTAPAEDAAKDESSGDGKISTPTLAAEAAEPVLVERLLSGLRIYPERDVVLHTTAGDIRIALRPDEAPNTAWNFLELCEGGFYRNVMFHRVVPLTPTGQPFVIQAGDPTGGGDGGPGYWLPIEDSKLPHDFGVISMARSDDPDSNGSQFFFCLSREGTARLDGQYCSFGYAVDGAATIKAIAEVELADIAAGRPVKPPVIKEAELVPAPPRTPGSGRPDARVTLQSIKKEEKPTGRVPR